MSRRVERAQVCVVGTGAAGGILAYRLASAGRGVLSLEQGEEVRDDYFTNGLSPEDEEHLGIAPDRPWPVAPSDAFFYENVRANRLYAGWLKQDAVDEIRHEKDPNSPYKLDE